MNVFRCWRCFHNDTSDLSLDLRPLFEASKKLHGYLVHDWFARYLGHLGASFQRLSEAKLLGSDWLPSRETDYAVALDEASLDLEKLTDAAGLYYLIYAHHKSTNRQLGGDPSVQRVLYLRGFEYQTDIGLAGGSAVTMMVPDSWQFTNTLGDKLRGNFGVLKALAPEDIYFLRYDAKPYFDRADFLALQNLAITSMSSVYFNANCWRDDMMQLVDRVDYFVVYLSSLTQSSLWEISLLREKRRQQDTTIVFDRDAVKRKGAPTGFDASIAQSFAAEVRWPGAAVPDQSLTADQWHELLSAEFSVVSPSDFFGDIERIQQCIAVARGPASDEERAKPLQFKFRPAVTAPELEALERYSRQLMTLTRSTAEKRRIRNLPWYMNVVQLAALTALLLGRHDEAGRALARYAGVISVLLERMFPDRYAGSIGVASSDDQPVQAVLQEHLMVVREVSWCLDRKSVV